VVLTPKLQNHTLYGRGRRDVDKQRGGVLIPPLNKDTALVLEHCRVTHQTAVL